MPLRFRGLELSLLQGLRPVVVTIQCEDEGAHAFHHPLSMARW